MLKRNLSERLGRVCNKEEPKRGRKRLKLVMEVLADVQLYINLIICAKTVYFILLLLRS